jgi:hypothetical protein
MRHAIERKMDFLSLEFGVTASSLWKVANRLGISASTKNIIEHDGVSAMRHLVEKRGG